MPLTPEEMEELRIDSQERMSLMELAQGYLDRDEEMPAWLAEWYAANAEHEPDEPTKEEEADEVDARKPR